MIKIANTDVIFAVLTMNGATIANMCLVGVNNLADVMRQLRKQVPSVAGLARLIVRNTTQGWARSHNIALSPLLG